MKKIAILSLGFLFLFTSCSKDNQTANKLEGIWNITSLVFDGDELILPPATKMEVTFTNVSKNTGRYNIKAYIFNILDTNNEANGDFSISNDGKKITMDDDDSTVGVGDGTIIEVTDSYMHISSINKDGQISVFKGEKK